MATATSNARPPRYPNEGPLQSRTAENDKMALKIAKLTCEGLVDKRVRTANLRKSRKTKAERDENEGSFSQDTTSQTILEARESPVSSSNTKSSKVVPRESSGTRNTEEQRSVDEQHEVPRPPFYGLVPRFMLPLKSMYDGFESWPVKKDLPDCAEQPSWGNIGFPYDDSLAIADIEEPISVNREEPSIIQLSQDIISIKAQDSSSVADDGNVKTEAENNRTIETFKLHGRTVCKVKFMDCMISNSSYSTCKTSLEIEKAITEAIGSQPRVTTVQYVAANNLLARGGQIGGRTQDYWRKARDLAQQQLFLNPDLEKEVQKQMKKDAESDVAFAEMLAIVKKCIKNNSPNAYYQSQRDEYGVKHGIFYQIKNVDIVMVLDKDNEVILFQLSDTFLRLLTKRVEREVVKALETYSTLQAVPLPDMTRHGLHYIDWLVEHPEFDFRRPENDPRVAKSGVYHFGAMCNIGDPNGAKNPGVTKDSGSRAMDKAYVGEQFAKLRHGAFTACTEMLNYVFGLLDPNLLEEYKKVAKQVASSWYSSLIDTRSRDETFVLRAVLVNLMTNEHKDSSDWHHGLAGLVPIGSFEGGDLLTRELGLQIESKPGCLQLFRGRELRHSITKWSGRRFVVTSSTHEAVKRWAFRRMGKPVSEDIPAVDDCLDVDQEDIRPEEQTILSEQERIPERYMVNTDDSDSMLDSDTSVDGASRSSLSNEEINK